MRPWLLLVGLVALAGEAVEDGAAVGLIGLGKIGTLLRRKLADYDLRVIAHDPFLEAARAAELEVEPVSLEEYPEAGWHAYGDVVDLPPGASATYRLWFRLDGGAAGPASVVEFEQPLATR